MDCDANKHFLALWNRALNEPTLDSMTTQLVAGWAAERGLDVKDVVEREVGLFAKRKCIVLSTGSGKACFPKSLARADPAWVIRNERAEKKAKLWEKVEWFSPVWVPRNKVDEIIANAEYETKEKAMEQFNYYTSTIYILSYQAVCIV